jgi:hypothetical protein
MNDRASNRRALDRILGGRVRRVELLARERRELEQPHELGGLVGIAQHAKQIDQLAVEVVPDLGIGARLPQAHAIPPPEGLNVTAVRAESD